jgi:hypothetical protein
VCRSHDHAAEAYLRISKGKMSLEELMEIIQQLKLRTGNFKNKPTSASELLFAEAQR